MKVIKQIFNSFVQGPVFIILFGLIFFGIGAGLTIRQANLEREGEQAQGEVIGLSESCDDDGCAYAPVVRFTTRAGQSVTFESTFYSSPPSYRTGERVTVNYPPDAPEKAGIKGEGMLFRIIFLVVGGLIMAVGLGMFSTSLVRSFLKD